MNTYIHARGGIDFKNDDDVFDARFFQCYVLHKPLFYATPCKFTDVRARTCNKKRSSNFLKAIPPACIIRVSFFEG
jgi:hypothetical protein